MSECPIGWNDTLGEKALSAESAAVWSCRARFASALNALLPRFPASNERFLMGEVPLYTGRFLMGEMPLHRPRGAGVRGHVPGVFLPSFGPMRDADAPPLPRLTHP